MLSHSSTTIQRRGCLSGPGGDDVRKAKVLLYLTWLFFLSTPQAFAAESLSAFRAGTIFFQEWNQTDTIDLTGQAYLFPDEILAPEHFTPELLREQQLAPVPDFSFDSWIAPQKSFRRSYIFKLQGNTSGQAFALRTGRITWAAKAFLLIPDKPPQLLTQIGDFTATPRLSVVPSYEKGRVVSLPPIQGEAYLLLQLVSPETYFALAWQPRIVEPFQLGLAQTFERESREGTALNFLVIGLYCLMVVNCIAFYWQNEKDIGNLLLAILGVALILRQLATTSQYSLLSQAPQWLAFQLSGLGVNLSQQILIALLPLFLYLEFPRSVSKKWLSYAGLLLTINTIAFCLLEPSLYLLTWGPFVILSLPIGLVLLRAYYRIFRDQEPGATIGFFSMTLLLATHINDLLVQSLRLDMPFLGAFGWAGLLFGQSLLVAAKFAAAHRKSESLAHDLKQKNFDLEQQQLTLQRVSLEKEITQKALLIESESRLAMAAAVAHRLNNPLNYIEVGQDNLSKNLDELEEYLTALLGGAEVENSEAQECIRQINAYFMLIEEARGNMEKGIHKAAQSIREMRALSGVDGYTLENFPIQAMWNDVLEHLQEHLPNKDFQRLRPLPSDLHLHQWSGNIYLMENCIEILIGRCLEHSIGELWLSVRPEVAMNSLLVEIRGQIKLDRSSMIALSDRFSILMKNVQTSIVIESDAHRVYLRFYAQAQKSAC